MTRLEDWRIRAFYISCLILVPFLKFLAWNDHGFPHLEVLTAVAWLAAASALLGWAGRGAGFYVVAGACLVMVATYPTERLVEPVVRIALWECAALVGAFAAAAMLLMRRRFFPVMAVFAWSGLLVQMLAAFPASVRARENPGNPPGAHVLWLVLDEHLGLNGFPDCAECAAAKRHLTATLDKYNFTVFPNAYSNYADTIDSIPSVVNQRLLARPQELIARAGTGQLRHYVFRRNRLFEEYRARGYRVEGYQHSSLRSCSADLGVSAPGNTGNAIAVTASKWITLRAR